MIYGWEGDLFIGKETWQGEEKGRWIVLLYLWKKELKKLILQRRKKAGKLLFTGKGAQKLNFLLNSCTKRSVGCFIFPGEPVHRTSPCLLPAGGRECFIALSLQGSSVPQMIQTADTEALPFQESLWNEVLYCSIEILRENLLGQLQDGVSRQHSEEPRGL